MSDCVPEFSLFRRFGGCLPVAGLLLALSACSSGDPERLYRFENMIQEEANQPEHLNFIHQQTAKALNLLQSLGLTVESDQTTQPQRHILLSGSTPMHREITVEITLLRYIDDEKPELILHLRGLNRSAHSDDSQDLGTQLHSMFQFEQ